MVITDLANIPFVKADLKRFEACLRDSVTGENQFLNEVSLHLITAGGKRLRPTLTFLSSRINSPLEDPASLEVIQGAVSIELVHLASLYHDDVIDEATKRRNVQTVNARWGNLIAIVAGDYLLARSAEIAAGLGAEIALLLASTLRELCRGQLSEIQSAFNFLRSEENYFSAIEGKTAALISAACKIGAMLTGKDPETTEALSQYGKYYGIAFQIRDDILDFIGSAEFLGKSPGQDLVEGIYTLPFIKTREIEANKLEKLISKLTPETVESARKLVFESGGINQSYLVAQEFVLKACSTLEKLSDTTTKTLLCDAAKTMIADLTSFINNAQF